MIFLSLKTHGHVNPRMCSAVSCLCERQLLPASLSRLRRCISTFGRSVMAHENAFVLRLTPEWSYTNTKMSIFHSHWNYWITIVVSISHVRREARLDLHRRERTHKHALESALAKRETEIENKEKKKTEEKNLAILQPRDYKTTRAWAQGG